MAEKLYIFCCGKNPTNKIAVNLQPLSRGGCFVFEQRNDWSNIMSRIPSKS